MRCIASLERDDVVGVRVPLVPRTTVSLVGTPSTQGTTLLRNLPTYAWLEGVLELLVFENGLTGSESVDFRLVRSAATDQDPRADFVTSTFASVAVTSATAMRALVTDDFTEPVPPFADLQIHRRQAAASPGSVEFALDLVLRGAFFDQIEWTP